MLNCATNHEATDTCHKSHIEKNFQTSLHRGMEKSIEINGSLLNKSCKIQILFE